MVPAIILLPGIWGLKKDDWYNARGNIFKGEDDLRNREEGIYNVAKAQREEVLIKKGDWSSLRLPRQ